MVQVSFEKVQVLLLVQHSVFLASESSIGAGVGLCPLLFSLSHWNLSKDMFGLTRKLPDSASLMGNIKSQYMWMISCFSSLNHWPPFLVWWRNFSNTVSFRTSKSVFINWNIKLPQSTLNTVKPHFLFKWAPHHILYFGMNLTPTIMGIFPANFPQMLTKIHQDLWQWSIKYFFWFGRNTVLNVIPRLLYLLKTLPVRIPKTFLKQLQGEFSMFLWAHKAHWLLHTLLSLPKPRLSASKVPIGVSLLFILPKCSGELWFLDLMNYHRAVHLLQALDWCTHASEKRWIQLKEVSLGIPLWDTPWVRSALPSSVTANLLVVYTARMSSRRS